MQESFLSAGIADVSADNTVVEKQKKKNMEKFINNAPFALVLVFLVVGFVKVQTFSWKAVRV